MSRCGGRVIGSEVDEGAQREVGFRGMARRQIEVEGVPVASADALAVPPRG